VQCLEYSDDEQERTAKAKLRKQKHGKVNVSGDVADDDLSSGDGDELTDKTTKPRQQRQYVTLLVF